MCLDATPSYQRNKKKQRRKKEKRNLESQQTSVTACPCELNSLEAKTGLKVVHDKDVDRMKEDSP